MRILVLGGGSFVGPALVDAARARGHAVSTFSRGRRPLPRDDVEALTGDRTTDSGRAPLRAGTWDAVLDTWAGAPRVVCDTARDLAGRADYYGYVSSRSVYRWPLPVGADESAPVVDARPDADATDYAADKRGAELAVLEHFTGRCLLARAGLILGPRENVGRLPWWLRRMADGGDVLAPGPPGRPLQLLDARDLADWMVRSAEKSLCGSYNSVSKRGHATMAPLLDACRAVTGERARLVWARPEQVLAAGIEPWTELPIWVPPHGETAGLHDGDVRRAHDAGLVCRPVQDTVADTWHWLRTSGDVEKPARPVGLSREKEGRLLADLLAGSGGDPPG